ncbi:MAG: precorrin-4 C(11)-methyltransferase [Lachnospiraceae bacterium]|nr:precorrin-4 C(11)-methyltransferase [Lachnospiraceae bacterium]
MISFVGAGPGAKDLITLRGRELIENADVIIYAGSLVNPELLEYADKNAVVYDSAGMTLNEIMDIMTESHRAGKRVVRLHTGDPALYGAIAEQMEILDRSGIEYDYCPGVSSLFGAASALKKEFTVPEKSQSLIITRITGRTPVPEKESIKSLAAHGTAMALFLSAGKGDELSGGLIEGGLAPDTPAAIVYKATWPEEKVVYSTVGELPKALSDNGIDKTALIFTGEFLKSNDTRSKLYDPDFKTGCRDAK